MIEIKENELISLNGIVFKWEVDNNGKTFIKHWAKKEYIEQLVPSLEDVIKTGEYKKA